MGSASFRATAWLKKCHVHKGTICFIKQLSNDFQQEILWQDNIF